MKKNFRTRLRLLIVLSLLLFCLIGFAVGKYIMTFKAPDTMTVTFSNNLADIFEVRESEATRDTTTGAYTLDKSKPVKAGQTYVLIPGVDIDKDPYVVIGGKSDIPAYLYIKVERTGDNAAITYALDDCWKESTTKVGFYVYCEDKTSPTAITHDYTEINVLKNQDVFVGQELQHGTKSNILKITAYLEEIPPTSP